MESKKLLKHLPIILIGLLPIGYLLFIWNTITGPVALHFNHKGDADMLGSRSELLVFMIFMAVTNLLVYTLMVNIHKVDPKRVKAGQSELYEKIGAGTVLFLTLISLIVILNSSQPEVEFWKKALVPIMGLFFAFLGNMMHNIKPNYFAGIRIPWTLSDGNNWKKTHRLGSTIWFWGGVIIVILGLTLPRESAYIAMLTIITAITIIPISYSYTIFKKNKPKQTKY